MRFLRSLILAALFVFVACSAMAGIDTIPGVERAHFVFYFDTPAYINRADSILTHVRARLIDLLGDSLPYQPAVHLVNDPQRFQELVGGYFPDWGAAAAASPRHLIAVKSPDKFRSNKPLSELLAHEYSHLALAHRTGFYRAPRWFDEGLAMTVSMEWSWSDNLAMSQAAVFGQILSLSEIDGVNTFNRGKAHVAYAESYLAVKYLFDDYGITAVNMFLDAVASGKSIDEALMASTGSNYKDFDREFRQMLQPRFNVVSLFMDTALFWVALAAIVVVAAIIRFRKRRKYYRQWDEYEKLHSTDFDYGDPDQPEHTDDEDEPWRR